MPRTILARAPRGWCDFGLGIVCLGWTPEGLKANAHRGLALFKELTAPLFREHFDVEFKPQLGLLQEAA